MTLVIIQKVTRKICPHVRHHVARRQMPLQLATQAGGTHWGDVGRSYPDGLIKNSSRSQDECQENRHPVGETRSPAMQQCLDGCCRLPIHTRRTIAENKMNLPATLG